MSITCSLCFKDVEDINHQKGAVYAYQEALELGSMIECFDVEDYSFPQTVSTIMLRTVRTKKISSETKAVTSGFSKILRDINAIQSGAARIDESWYLLWQIIRVVHGFATKCVCWDIQGEDNSGKLYSLDRLCKKVDINIDDAKKMFLEVDLSNPIRKKKISKKAVVHNHSSKDVSHRMRKSEEKNDKKPDH